MVAPEPDRVTNMFGALVLVAADRMRQATDEAAKHGSAAPAALVALHEFLGGCSVDDLRRVVGLTHSGAVRMVDRLVEEGYVVRRAGTDGRSLSLMLTSSGRRVARKVLAARGDVLSRMLDTLTADERAALAGVVEKLLQVSTAERLAERERGRSPGGGWTCRLCDFAACGRDRGMCPAAITAASLAGGLEKNGPLG